MMKRSGFADLPLHGGRVPQWLSERMTKLGTAIVEVILQRYGASEFLSRLADPFWFQALGCVMGMDWHSSGITTSVMGALKRGLATRADEFGIYICGGRGRHSRNTPNELRTVAERKALDGEALVRTSRLTARIDNNAIADGFQIYLHTFVVSAEGEWTVVQQGMNEANRLARRYHWHSSSVRDFTSQPHTGIVGEHQGTIMNLVDSEARRAQQALLTIVREHPDATLREARRLVAPARHEVRPQDTACRGSTPEAQRPGATCFGSGSDGTARFPAKEIAVRHPLRESRPAPHTSEKESRTGVPTKLCRRQAGAEQRSSPAPVQAVLSAPAGATAGPREATGKLPASLARSAAAPRVPSVERATAVRRRQQ